MKEKDVVLCFPYDDKDREWPHPNSVGSEVQHIGAGANMRTSKYKNLCVKDHLPMAFVAYSRGTGSHNLAGEFPDFPKAGEFPFSVPCSRGIFPL